MLFLSASILVAGIEIERVPARREPLSLAVLFAGFAFIRANPIVLGAILLDLFAVLFGGALALLPIFARDIFAVGPWGLGILRACPAAGALATGIVLSRTPFRRHVGRMMFAGVAAYGAATIAFGLSTSFVLSMAALAALGASDMVSVVVRQTLVQIETPDAMRGRVSAVNSLFVAGSNQIGDFRAGVMAAWFGTIPAVLIGGVGTLAIAVVWIKAFPALFKVESFGRRR
jgi:MFS family permease